GKIIHDVDCFKWNLRSVQPMFQRCQSVSQKLADLRQHGEYAVEHLADLINHGRHKQNTADHQKNGKYPVDNSNCYGASADEFLHKINDIDKEIGQQY